MKKLRRVKAIEAPMAYRSLHIRGLVNAAHRAGSGNQAGAFEALILQRVRIISKACSIQPCIPKQRQPDPEGECYALEPDGGLDRRSFSGLRIA